MREVYHDSCDAESDSNDRCRFNIDNLEYADGVRAEFRALVFGDCHDWIVKLLAHPRCASAKAIPDY